MSDDEVPADPGDHVRLFVGTDTVTVMERRCTGRACQLMRKPPEQQLTDGGELGRGHTALCAGKPDVVWVQLRCNRLGHVDFCACYACGATHAGGVAAAFQF